MKTTGGVEESGKESEREIAARLFRAEILCSIILITVVAEKDEGSFRSVSETNGGSVSRSSLPVRAS